MCMVSGASPTTTIRRAKLPSSESPDSQRPMVYVLCVFRYFCTYY